MNGIKSPFPGMDPFLELPSLWRSVHTWLITAFSNLINETLPDNFVVQIEGTTKIVDLNDDNYRSAIVPDLYITKPDPIRSAQYDTVAIAEPTTSIRPAALSPVIEERWLEIVDRYDDSIVTTIEILSPFNKQGDGYIGFHRKRDVVWSTGCNWLEIDLLRGGKRPHSILDDTPYYAMLIPRYMQEWLIWEMKLREPLLTIGVPLKDGYDDIPLDLQRAIDAVYRDGRYYRTLRYRDPVPAPRLSDDDQAWVTERLAVWEPKR